MAANEKKPAGFFLYPEHVRAVCAMLTCADAGRLLLALCDYAESGALPTSPRRAFQAAFSLLQGDIDRDAERYREICERNRELANRRWHSDPPPQPSSASPLMPGHAQACQRMPPHAYTTQPNTTQPNTTQPNTTQPSTTQPNTTQPSTTQPSAAQPSTTQPSAAQPSTTQPNPAQPAAAAAAPGPFSPVTTKGAQHDPSGNSRKISGTRGTTL